MNAHAWRATLAATLLMGLTQGSRSAFGLFLSPLNTATGIGAGAIGLSVAVGHLALGVAQPVLASLAERHGAARLMAGGACLLAVCTALLAYVGDAWTLTVLVLLMSLAGCALGSNAVLMAELGRRVPATVQGMAAGIVGAGGSAGQLVFGPLTQWLIGGFGWRVAAWATAAAMLIALPLASAFGRSRSPDRGAALPSTDPGWRAILRDRRFRLIGASFTLCGFHVTFLTTHMPGVIERCGLPLSLAGTWLAVAGAANMAGSIGIGALMRRWSSPLLLGLLYATRAVAIATLLVVPVTPAVMLAFALVMGLTYLAPLAPTAQLLAQHFGVHRLGTLLGMVMVGHQAGAFAGAWLGGLAVEITRGYTPLWIADLLLALVAAALQWPLRGGVTGSAAAPRTAGPRRSACAARSARPAA
ncbi:MFS transporter [Piscinibacter sp. XHJ-5]|uniref:MFS transporter n=1 Tax=Piscinibacter sp. XHJ-5 TaxID=3037797 RepID=UPI0024530982|nr:MFS transporter [Piscinibacter sp. XHJ-5]